MPYASNNKLSKAYKDGWVEISIEYYKELLFIHMGQHAQYKGFLNENGQIVKIPREAKETPVVEIEFFIEKAKKQIDQAAGEARLRYITESPGQTGVYLEKMKQAASYLENTPSNMDGYEYIVGEAEARGVTYPEAAQLIMDIANYWNKQISPAIEKIRINAKHMIDTLPPEADAQDALDISSAAITKLNQF